MVFPVQADGATGTPVANNSHGNTPFSEAFTPAGVLVVVESAGAPGGGAAASPDLITSYREGRDELNLAEFPISAPLIQSRTMEHSN